MPSQTYSLTGLHCESCVDAVTKRLLASDAVTGAKVSFHPPQAVIDSTAPLTADQVNAWLAPLARYQVSDIAEPPAAPEAQPSWRPLILILIWLLSTTAAVQIGSGGFHLESAMTIFMGGFFLVFSFFKLLNLRGFAMTYRRYDLVAKAWPPYALAWPFIEFALGLAYLAGIQPRAVNLITAVLMAVSLAGVLRAVLSKQQIQCACLGTGFNLPIGTVTIIEDALMLVMAVVMML